MTRSVAHSLWTIAAGRMILREEPLPEPGADQVRVRTRWSAISRGTETLVFQGQVPVSEFQRMRAPHQRGEFSFPIQYGYAAVGVVEAGAEALLGHNVFCLHPHQDRFVVSADAVHRLPDGLPPERAVLAANMETAVNGMWDGDAGVGDRISVVGAGVVGCLVARLASRIPGTRVCLVDVRAEREALARDLGCSFALPDQAPAEQDRVFHVSGSPAGLETALSIAGDESRIIEMSWYGDRKVPLPLGEAFHSRRLELISSQVGRLPITRRSRWDHARRMALALELLDDPALDALFEPDTPFHDLPRRMHKICSGSGLCHRVAYPG